MRAKTSYPAFLIALVLMAALACNLPFMANAPTGDSSPVAPVAPVAPAAPGNPPAPTPTSTVLPAINHVLVPADVNASGSYNYDVDSSGTAPEHRAPYGDSYDRNLFERPFTQSVMDYLAELDIVTFRMVQDNTWTYVFVELTGGDLNSSAGVDYGVEIDTNHDGFGDVLVWAHPPYAATWSTDTVKVYTDTNHDTGGLSAEKSDAVLGGNGYDTVIFDRTGSDPDLAWVRLDPHTASTIDFAFKRSLAGNAFMWGAWADAGLKDPSKFNYNDRFKEADAGSPEKSEQYYPIKAIYEVDNTCWVAVGFKPTGEEPHLCPSTAPPATRKPKPIPTPPTPVIG